MERAALNRAPGGVERERSGRLAGATRHEFRARATGRAARAQAEVGTESRKAHRGGRWIAKEGKRAPRYSCTRRDRKLNVSTGLISTDCSTRPRRVSRLAAKDRRSPCAIGRQPLAKRAGRIPARPPPARKLRSPNHRRSCLSIHSTRRREDRPLKDPQQRTAAHAETQIAMPCAFNAFCGIDVEIRGKRPRRFCCKYAKKLRFFQATRWALTA